MPTPSISPRFRYKPRLFLSLAIAAMLIAGCAPKPIPKTTTPTLAQ